MVHRARCRKILQPPPARPGLPLTHTNRFTKANCKLLCPLLQPSSGAAARFTCPGWMVRDAPVATWPGHGAGVQRGQQQHLPCVFVFFLLLHAGDVVLSQEAWDSVTKASFPLFQRKARAFEAGSGCPGTNPQLQFPRCRCVPVSRGVVRAFAPGAPASEGPGTSVQEMEG